MFSSRPPERLLKTTLSPKSLATRSPPFRLRTHWSANTDLAFVDTKREAARRVMTHPQLERNVVPLRSIVGKRQQDAFFATLTQGPLLRRHTVSPLFRFTLYQYRANSNAKERQKLRRSDFFDVLGVHNTQMLRLRGIGLRKRAPWSLAPKPFKIVKITRRLVEDVHDHIAKIHQDPLPVGEPFDR